ncbi:hypothetical protein KCP69_04550 [Salmonella enterica subsp. enterica]|nr:hypothetical protein KCP69_04550 [Salmonella enterica subsp. enterica]
MAAFPRAFQTKRRRGNYGLIRWCHNESDDTRHWLSVKITYPALWCLHYHGPVRLRYSQPERSAPPFAKKITLKGQRWFITCRRLSRRRIVMDASYRGSQHGAGFSKRPSR